MRSRIPVKSRPLSLSPNPSKWVVTPRLHGSPVARTSRSILTYHFVSAPPEALVSSHQFIQAHKRRSTRIDQAIPIVVQGVGALREPYAEQVSTLSISCHGCTYQSKHEVIQGETVYLEIKPPNVGPVVCSSRARVKWVQKLGVKERVFQVAVELEVAGNIWGVPSPPGDWFPAKMPEAMDPTASGREIRG